MKDNVVITGVGTASPVGSTHAAVLARLRQCTTALVHHDFGDGVEMPFAQVAPDADELSVRTLDFLDPHEQEIVDADNAIRYGIYAAGQAVDQSRIDLSQVDPWRVAMAASGSKGQFRSLRCARLMMEEIGLSKLTPQQRADFGLYMFNFPGDTLGRYLARRYDGRGPMMSYPAACATGVYSIASAAALLLEDRADYVLAGSSESTRNATPLAGFRNMGATSPTICRPFDRNRSGFSPGEGAGIFAMERETDARARGASILWRVCGWDTRSDPYHITGVDERAEVAEYSLRRVLKQADWDPATVDYFNAHGTGTPQNDAAEARLVHRVCGSPGPYVSSLKGTLGHCLGASASVELTVAAISLWADFIPPTLLCEDPDPATDDIRLVRQPGVEHHTRRWVKSSLGFGGHIGMLAIERAD